MAHDDLLALSERMVAAARRGDWNAVATLETERGSVITGVPVTEPSSLPLFRTLLAHTHEVRDLAQRHRERLGDDLNQHQHRHRALSAYLNAGID
jgi:flagellar protein FliT